MPTIINPRLISWASDIDAGTILQAERSARLPIVEDHIALMPDAHYGMGATVGSVIPTKGAIIPAAVGVDLGCGMIAAELDVTEDQLPDSLDPLLPRIAKAVPAGVGQGHAHGGRSAQTWMASHRPATDISGDLAERALKQFGSLGAGNHFFELCIDERGHVWVVLHSGSRGIGNKLATQHIATARKLTKAAQTPLEDPDLAYLLQGTPEFDAYITDMLWAQDYALANRTAMMDAAMTEVLAFIGTGREVARINCFAGDTRVMTSSGPRELADLSGGVHELLTADGVWVKAPVMSFGDQPLMRVTLSRNGVEKIVHATPEHVWLLRTHSSGGVRYWGKRPAEAPTKDLLPGDRLAWTFTRRPPSVAVDRLAAAQGFVFGDGSTSGKTKARALFCGEKDRSMLSLFEGLGCPPRHYPSLSVVNGLPRAWKTETPSLDSPPAVLYGWLAGYFAADGDVGKTGRPTLSSASLPALEFVRLLCDVVGIGTFGIRRLERLGYGAAPSPLYLVGLMRGDLDPDFFLIPAHRDRFVAGRRAVERRGWTVVNVEWTDRIEEVFCAVVENTHSFALEDNILTRNCHHNFTQREIHQGRQLWITRKGAIKADVGDYGVIPGSMGTRSYIVRGRGNPASWNSCSHGAGRRMSRTQAKKQFTPADLATQMAGKTWQSDLAGSLVDEIPSSYKDIDQVMADQADLVEVLHTLHQVLNYKGT